MDKEAKIEEWFLEYSNHIYNYLIYFTGERDVEDLVQEVYIKAFQSLDRFEGRSNPKTWLISIARHLAIDAKRKKKITKWIPFEWLHSHASKETTPEEHLQFKEKKKVIYKALQNLKSSYRDVIILRRIEEFSVTETAEILAWDEAKVRLTLHRAMKELQKYTQVLEERGFPNEE